MKRRIGIIAALMLAGCGSGLDTDVSSNGLDPRSIPSLQLWLYPADFGGSYSDNAVITTNWLDRSGHGFSIPPTGSPHFHTTAGPNGSPTVSFTPAPDNFHLTVSNFASGVTGLTVFLVGRDTAGAGDFMGVSSGTTFASGYDFFVLGKPGGSFGFSVGQAAGPVVYSATYGASYGAGFNIHVAEWDPSAAMIFYTVGTSGTVSLAAAALASISPTQYLNVGSATNNLTGDIAEILVYLRTLSPSETSRVHQYLSERYGLQ